MEHGAGRRTPSAADSGFPPLISRRGLQKARRASRFDYSDENSRNGTDREISASFDRESSATQVDRAMRGKVSAYANLARHAVRCAGQRQRQSVA